MYKFADSDSSTEQKEYSENPRLREIRNRVLQNDLIVDNILSKFSLSDVKSCRVVCRKWNTVSKKYFVKLSHVSLRSTTTSIITNTENPIKLFNEIFPKPFEFPFKKFRLEGKFLAEDLKKLFNDRPFIQELTFYEFTVMANSHKKLPTYNVNNWSLSQLTSLVVSCNPDNWISQSANLTIPLSCIGGTQNFEIRGRRDQSENGPLVVLDGRIAPVKLVFVFGEILWDGKIFRYGDILPLNDHIDVTNLKEATLHHLLGEFHFDLTDCLRLKRLSLVQGKLLGWHSNLVLKSLEIRSVQLDLLALPPSVEELNMDRSLLYSRKDNFPNLKSLIFSGNWENEDRRINLLVSLCPNVVRMELLGDGDVDLDRLPTTVKIFAANTKCGMYGRRNVSLDRLVLRDLKIERGSCHFDRINDAIDRCNGKTVVIDVSCSCTNFYLCLQRRSCAQGFQFLLGLVNRQMNKEGVVVLKMRGCGNRALGLPPTSQTLQVSLFPKYDIQEDYFLCENGLRRTIDEKEFDNWANGY